MIKYSLLSIFTIFFFQTSSHAGVLFEPYAGYESGNINYKFKSSASFPDTYNDSISGAAYGAKLAYTFPMFFIGADGNLFTGTQKYDSKINATPAQVNATRTTIYALAGINIQKLRLWFGYSPSDITTVKVTRGDDTYSGTAVRLGIGYHFLPHLSINFEYDMHTVNDYTPAGGTAVAMDTYFSQYSYNAYMVSASFPFMF